MSLSHQRPSPERRRRLTHRAIPALAALAFLVGLIAGALGGTDASDVAGRFTQAWAHSDYRSMYAMLTPAARKRVTEAQFERSYREALATATAVSIRVRRVHDQGPGAAATLAFKTRIFGDVRGSVLIPVRDSQVDWSPNLTFVELRPGATLTRETRVPERAPILARNGATIVSGPAAARGSPPGNPAAGIAGSLAPPSTPAAAADLYAAGFPQGTPVGSSGLERLFEPLVRGTPGGVLRAGNTVLARTAPHAARPVRTTLDLHIQAAAEEALAGRYGGIAALDATTGEIRALAGVAGVTQPPGSTFKIITATAGLTAGIVRPSSTFPVQTRALVDGVPLQNANGEACGGTFANAFAVSCNSVFVPLGVRVGDRQLVATAERFGFNSASRIPGIATSTIPTRIASKLELGASAIGQGKVLATPIELADVAQAIANGGVRRDPTLVAGSPAPPVRAASAAVAATVGQLMIGVVTHGTGTAASLAPVAVAGKTGTAELGNTVPGQAASEQGGSGQINTDAWFTGYAPAHNPRLVVCAMFVKAGAGGDVAAPAVRTVLAAGLSG